MPQVTVNSLPVLEARLVLARVGAWSAEVNVDAATASLIPDGTAVSLSMDPRGLLSFSGTALRSDSYAQNVSLRIQGGRRGLARQTFPRFYQGTPVRQPVGDVLAAGGEVLSPLADAVALGNVLRFWTTRRQRVSQALTLLADAAGPAVVWRVLPDGTVWFGTDVWAPSALVDYQVVDYRPLDGVQVIASEVPDLFPGESFGGRNVSAVEHVVNERGNTARIWFEA